MKSTAQQLSEALSAAGVDPPGEALLYLASPYRCPTEFERRERFGSACKVAGALTAAGFLVFSPIAHGGSIASFVAVHDGLIVSTAAMDAALRRFDLAVLRRCDALLVLCLDGWRDSKGVAAEIAWPAPDAWPDLPPTLYLVPDPERGLRVETEAPA